MDAIEEMITQPYRDLNRMIGECGSGVDGAVVDKARALLAKMRSDLTEIGIDVRHEIAASPLMAAPRNDNVG